MFQAGVAAPSEEPWLRDCRNKTRSGVLTILAPRSEEGVSHASVDRHYRDRLSRWGGCLLVAHLPGEVEQRADVGTRRQRGTGFAQRAGVAGPHLPQYGGPRSSGLTRASLSGAGGDAARGKH